MGQDEAVVQMPGPQRPEQNDLFPKEQKVRVEGWAGEMEGFPDGHHLPCRPGREQGWLHGIGGSALRRACKARCSTVVSESVSNLRLGRVLSPGGAHV